MQENKRMDQALTLISVKTTIGIGGNLALVTFQLPFLNLDSFVIFMIIWNWHQRLDDCIHLTTIILLADILTRT